MVCPMMDKDGYRLNVGIILVNDEGLVFWARRIGQRNGWQFPQGGMQRYETPTQTMYRELKEETGLSQHDVKILSVSKRWLYYRLPKKHLRHHIKPLCIGQKQKWFLLQLVSSEKNINFNTTDSPEFNDWQWVEPSHPLTEVIHFKKRVYKLALEEFEPMIEQLAIGR